MKIFDLRWGKKLSVILMMLMIFCYSSQVWAKFYNAGIYINKDTAKHGETVTLTGVIKSTLDKNNVFVTIGLHEVSEQGVIAAEPTFFQIYPDQNFVANVSIAYKVPYLVPDSITTGKYAMVMMAGSQPGLGDYLNSRGNSGPWVINLVGISYLRGINIMDMGIAGHVVPGVYNTNYTRPTLASLQALKERGLDVVRLPFLWERVQHTLGGPLDSAYMGLVIQVLKDCKTVGLKAILDMHNYARYRRDNVVRVFGNADGPTKTEYGDAWSKIATAVKAETDAYDAVYAYDIMNEPYGLPSNTGVTSAQVWEEYAQAAVTAIRNTADNKLIHVEGYTYSAAHRFPTQHPTPFITDPANNIMYHAHMYLDNDSSGAYVKTFDEEEALALAQGFTSVGARAVKRVKNFSDWCSQYGLKCFLGEFGWPNAYFVGSTNAQKWNEAGEELMSFMDSVRMGGTMWATGSWLKENGNILNTYVLPNGTRPFSALSQSEVLENHPGRP